ncbi:hypothetical protein TI39_contig456g00006 [Zymoseptoria brevis]|uniref:Uncharacterized protein n=1 Tax=Zymoseptoria brevis TaxID=1047168 RepID=A0A0F4GL88_9PEZI|nr:hypothetical protein TI39_contig456g00006 [Zymoseptoria brevis]
MLPENAVLIRRTKLSDTAVITAFTAGLNYIAAGLDNGTVSILRPNGEPIRTLPASDGAHTPVSLAMREHCLVVGYTTGMIEYWDLNSGARNASFKAHERKVTSLIIHDAETVISCSRDTTVKIWLTTPDPWICQHILNDHTDIVTKMTTHNNILASASHDGTCKLWSIPTAQLIHDLATHEGTELRSLAFDGNIIISGNVQGILRCWNASDGSFKAIRRSHTSLISHICIAEDVVVTAGADGKLVVWSKEGMVVLWSVKAHPYAVNGLEVGDGLVVTGGSCDVVKVWRLSDGSLAKEMGEKSDAVWKVGFTGDGSGNLFHAYWNKGAVVDILRLDTGPTTS